MDDLRTGVHRFLENLSEGWHLLMQSTGNAITHFKPAPETDGTTDTGSVPTPINRWGILAAEVIEKKDLFVVRLEAPGMSAEDFDIQARDKRLIICGEKKPERMTEKGQYHIMERAYGRFERTIPLPANVNEKETSASYANGILNIWLPKSTDSAKRTIKVEAK